ncbi:hypothetical protein Pedsa_0938 [Pseudopedobacter saltans DSM 12145]|uniref:Uncharacterized protein n=1 Tax=Pseudopedobacter saltans (strain ATCC 51119 / DSM 12145 / JCM 21818 / CCUG 39354 / LMG 10337 / NBRC 100064 / NCIMB 13643) TaxID=762903 RepID=F0SAD3_PSESL|nr:hypothetical protein [Pseudopedobacter saltans]ADY51510.1 hypothetical protein Pedsa_0938 [Pseudopedobacter saltans DSM 12145]
MYRDTKITIDINKVEFYDLDNQKIDIPEFYKLLGNSIFKEANSIEVSDLARILHKGESPEATQQEIEEIIYLLNTSIKYKAFVQKPLLDYFNRLLTDLNDKKDGKNN